MNKLEHIEAQAEVADCERRAAQSVVDLLSSGGLQTENTVRHLWMAYAVYLENKHALLRKKEDEVHKEMPVHRDPLTDPDYYK